MSASIKSLLVFLLLFTLYNCAELARQVDTIKPTAQVTGARIADINFEQADIVFDLAVENKNPIAINLAGLDYDFKVENQSLISGTSDKPVNLAANAVSAVQLPVSLRFDDLKKLPGEVWQKDNVAYDLGATLNIMLPVIGKYAVPLRKQGQLPVPRMPQVKLSDIKIKNLGFTAADVVAQVEINNPNNFDLGIKNLAYQLDINRKKWGQGKITQTNTIPKKGKGIIEIPLSLDLMSMGTAIYGLLQDKSAFEYRLTGNATLDTGIELLRNYSLPLDISGKAAVR